MSERSYHHGRFVWHEIITSDVSASEKFYGALFGWSARNMPMAGGFEYPMIMNGDQMIGGFVDKKRLGKEGIPSHWLGYVSVPNVDESAAAAKSGGGTIGVPPMDIPGVGRFSIIGDPHHAYTAAFKSAEGDAAPPMPPPVGAFCWDEVNTHDVEALRGFYGKVYGWTSEAYADMGYVFKVGDAQVAGCFALPAPSMHPHWRTYVVVESLAAARQKVVSLGGKIALEEIEVPNVGMISAVIDNVGAGIGLFEAPRA